MEPEKKHTKNLSNEIKPCCENIGHLCHLMAELCEDPVSGQRHGAQN